MAIDVDHELETLKHMTTADLRERYAQLHGEQSRSGNREYLIKRVIWRLQAVAEGDMTERAARIRARAMELARDADLRLHTPGACLQIALRQDRAPRTRANPPDPQSDRRRPMPGALLNRRYHGRTITVRVLEKGFEYEGQTFRSLSAIAHAVTGSHWNGWLFFGLTPSSNQTEATQ